MRMSEKGRELLTQWEGEAIHPDCSCQRVYNDVAGFPTIGIGHLLTKDELTSGKILIFGKATKYRDGLTDDQVDRLLTQDLAGPEGAVNCGITVALTQCQFDALISFVFNVGRQAFYSSTLRRMLNEGKYDQTPIQMRRWNKSGGRVIDGLVNRRENEIKLFEGII